MKSATEIKKTLRESFKNEEVLIRKDEIISANELCITRVPIKNITSNIQDGDSYLVEYKRLYDCLKPFKGKATLEINVVDQANGKITFNNGLTGLSTLENVPNIKKRVTENLNVPQTVVNLTDNGNLDLVKCFVRLASEIKTNEFTKNIGGINIFVVKDMIFLETYSLTEAIFLKINIPHSISTRVVRIPVNETKRIFEYLKLSKSKKEFVFGFAEQEKDVYTLYISNGESEMFVKTQSIEGKQLVIRNQLFERLNQKDCSEMLADNICPALECKVTESDQCYIVKSQAGEIEYRAIQMKEA